LGFEHPDKKEYMRFDSELPEGFNKILEKWRKYVSTEND
jgi:23S rRNA pseudouridine1911/1915/1917 synthase